MSSSPSPTTFEIRCDSLLLSFNFGTIEPRNKGTLTVSNLHDTPHLPANTYFIDYAGEIQMSNLPQNIPKILFHLSQNEDFVADSNKQQRQIVEECLKRFNLKAYTTMTKKLTRVCVVVGHSYSTHEKKSLPNQNVCLLTLSKKNDFLILGFQSKYLFSGIQETLDSDTRDNVSGIVALYQDKRLTGAVTPVKSCENSIRVRCGGTTTTTTEQIFYGELKDKYNVLQKQGIFMFEKGLQPRNISNKLLRLSPQRLKEQEQLYSKTTDFQKRIIEFEIQTKDSLDETKYKEHFKDEIDQFNVEWEALKKQRMDFLQSMGYNIMGSAVHTQIQSIDVVDLEILYRDILLWEQENLQYACDFFEQTQNAIHDFMTMYHIDDNKINNGYLMLLSALRRDQIEKFLEERECRLEGNPDVFKRDFQLIPPLYESISSFKIIDELTRFFPRDQIMIVFIGCRGSSNPSQEDPYHSECDDETLDLGGGGGEEGREIKSRTKSKIKSRTKSIKKSNTKHHKNKKYIFRKTIKKGKKYIKKSNRKILYKSSQRSSSSASSSVYIKNR